MTYNISIDIEAGPWGDDEYIKKYIEKAIQITLKHTGIIIASHAELSICLTDNKHITNLNHLWRGKNGPTNVLSFPMDGAQGPMIGDIVLAYDTLKFESEREEKPFYHHFFHLIVHGFLHILGYDHQIKHDAELMETLEVEILAELGIKDPYKHNVKKFLN